eukprot:CAMPEP_0172508444 /NCGR_PEP_ID=MMETSP1066-20121228/211938_1 /TAXON_ID=671091 /ORGANISM="Coscinodiscus wailesii, Strain CCMP2513" /LENGTH=73 /DNA_ID=CAMNT_0013286423 /DNA_START=3 /DNA_END=221 /DNA_ORIENTATION=-
MSSQLQKLCRVIALPKFTQGSLLKIRSPRNVPLDVVLEPEWRDDARLTLTHTFSKDDNTRNAVDMTVTTEERS